MMSVCVSFKLKNMSFMFYFSVVSNSGLKEIDDDDDDDDELWIN